MICTLAALLLAAAPDATGTPFQMEEVSAIRVTRRGVPVMSTLPSLKRGMWAEYEVKAPSMPSHRWRVQVADVSTRQLVLEVYVGMVGGRFSRVTYEVAGGRIGRAVDQVWQRGSGVAMHDPVLSDPILHAPGNEAPSKDEPLVVGGKTFQAKHFKKSGGVEYWAERSAGPLGLVRFSIPGTMTASLVELGRSTPRSWIKGPARPYSSQLYNELSGLKSKDALFDPGTPPPK